MLLTVVAGRTCAVNTIDSAIKTISISAWLIVPVQRMHLKVITLHGASTDQVMT